MALALTGCAGIEHRSTSTVPEPPPWNSIDMMWLKTEITRLDSPSERLPGDVPAAPG